MKTFIYFILTCLISTFAFFGALANKHNPWPCFAIAFCIWGLFIWGYNRRLKREAVKRNQERMFAEYMRSRFDGSGR